MEATLLSVGKSVLNGALGYAKSTVAAEVALQLGVRRDQASITDELEMMQGFLMTANDEGHDNNVVAVWVKQVRDVSYEVEDCLLDFAVRLEKQSWWHIPRTLLDRRQVAQRMKELRVKVEDVNKRNLRYRLVNGPSAGPNPISAAAWQSSSATMTMFGAKLDKANVDLVKLINKKDDDLRVISVWGTGGDVGHTSIIRACYENPYLKMKFPCRAWVRVMHPFSPREFVQSLLKQFHAAVLGVDDLLEMEKTGQDLAQELKGYVNEKRYLIVLTDLSTIEEWDQIKACFPNNKKGSRIIVSTMQAEVANLCVGKKSIVSELKQLSAHQTIYAFQDKGSPREIDFTTESSSTTATTGTMPTCIRLMAAAMEASHLVGREKEKSDIIKLISVQSIQQIEVTSVWGMGGVGKTTLVKDIYQSQELLGMFDKHAYVTLTRPFILEELLRSLVMQLNEETSEEEDVVGLLGSTNKRSPLMSLAELIKLFARHIERKRCFIVLDDLSSTAEWDLIIHAFCETENTSQIIVTTREQNIARHCSQKEENIYKLGSLGLREARRLFTTKVLKETIDLKEQYPELADQAELILRKCNGFPLAIVTIGSFLANQSKTSEEWRKINELIVAEVYMNPELGIIRAVLIKSYEGLPYHLKSCLLYMSIFLEDQKVSRTRLVRRWTAEGYSRVAQVNSVEETTDNYFMELISRSMILPTQQSIRSTKGIDSCQVHDLIGAIGNLKSMEEKLVFRLEEGCSLNRVGTVRHLAINTNWEGGQNEFESIVDTSHTRSLTVFGKWRPFFLSEKMRLLQVLDLEDTSGLVDHHLEHIGNLLHLRYLSLRGCLHIYHLPDSLGNLRQLQTLDIVGTSIFKLPSSIIKLTKLQHILAGAIENDDDNLDTETSLEDVPKIMRNRLCVLTLSSVALCVGCCSPHLMAEQFDMDGDVNRHDVCTACCCSLLPALATHQGLRGVAVPRGIRKLDALHTLGTVNIAWGKAALEDIRRLGGLRKLRVTGINKRNSREFCSTIAHLRCLESLLVQSAGKPGLSGCLDGLSSPPNNLRTLKLYGNIVTLPEWVGGLKNIVKLKLRSSRILEHDTAIQILGSLPKLAILRLCKESFDGDEVRVSFHRGAFPCLVLLELDRLGDLKSVKFEGGTTKLEVLQFRTFFKAANIGLFSGLEYLPSLKEFKLMGTYEHTFMADLQKQLAWNQNRRVVVSH